MFILIIMKNICLFVIAVLLAAITYGQNYNLGFENWSGTTTFTSLSASSTGLNCHPYLMKNAETVFMAGSVPDNQIIDAWSARVHGIMRTTDAYSGTYAAIVHMWYAGSKGIMALGSTEYTYTKIPKVKLNSKIYGVSGFYKYQVDSFVANDTFKKNSLLHIVTYQNVAGTAQKLTHDSLTYTKSDIYQPFSLSVNYPNTSVVPDSVSIWFESKGYGSGGTSCELAHFLMLDELQFHFIPLSNAKDVLKANFKIFPNPANDIIDITYQDNFEIKEIRLLDISGKVVKMYKTTNRQLDVSGVSSGIYLLNIQTDKGRIHEKIWIR